MSKFKRAFCGILAAFFILYVPFASYASLTASVAVSAGSYIINLILNACGVDLSASSISAMIGEWQDYDDFMAKGAKGELGAYSQHLYDVSQTAVEYEVRESGLRQIKALTDAVNSTWGTVVTGVKELITGIKNWLLGVDGYGTVETTYYVERAHSAGFIFGVDSYVSADYFPLRSQPSYSYIYQVLNNPENEYSFGSFYPTVYEGYAKVQNFYKPKTVTVAGLFSGTAANPRTDFYYKSGDTVKAYNFFYHYETLDADGNYKFNLQTSSHGTISYITCKNCNALPFPVFTSLEAVEKYLNTGEAVDVYDPDKIILEADAINPDIQNMPLKAIPDTITLPGSKEEAIQKSNEVSAALVEGQDSLKNALDGAGITIDWGKEETPEKPDPPKPDDDKKKPVWLGWVIGEILDWLLGETLEDLIDWLLDGTREINEDEGEIIVEPVAGIKDRFPFCIPFDVIYLVRALEADSEIPRFEIPINISYEFIEYHEVFIVDFYDWITVVNILRVMLDIWFLAGLIVVTRDLMRG